MLLKNMLKELITLKYWIYPSPQKQPNLEINHSYTFLTPTQTYAMLLGMKENNYFFLKQNIYVFQNSTHYEQKKALKF